VFKILKNRRGVDFGEMVCVCVCVCVCIYMYIQVCIYTYSKPG